MIRPYISQKIVYRLNPSLDTSHKNHRIRPDLIMIPQDTTYSYLVLLTSSMGWEIERMNMFSV